MKTTKMKNAFEKFDFLKREEVLVVNVVGTVESRFYF